MEWWQSGVVYQIYPRSFADADGDGIGDLAGILSRVEYLADTLGIDAVWLSPFYPSPQADFGYDVADYTDVDPVYGTLADFAALVAACHDRGIRVIVDFVPNHSSDRHGWFLQSRSARDDPKRDWYTWRDPAPDGGPPNNWISVFGGPAWELDEATGQYYLHSFLKEQPDLNWRNTEVRAAMHDVLRFWLDRGVDGFRIDVAHRIAKDPELRSNPLADAATSGPGKDHGEYDTLEHLHDAGHPDVHEYFREIRAVLDEYDDRYSIGEIHEYDWQRWASYIGEGDELHQVFDFSLLFAPWEAAEIRARIAGQEDALPPGGWPNHVLGNHDEPRIARRLGSDHARLAALVLLTTRGTPTLYYGDELGMTQPDLPVDRQLDPWAQTSDVAGRDGCRTPMQWEPAVHAGFSPPEAVRTWLPVDGAPGTDVASQLADPDSMLNFYRRCLTFRRASAALRGGDYRPRNDVPAGVLAFTRSRDGETVTVVLNLGDEPATATARGTVVLATDRAREGERTNGTAVLAPAEGIVFG